MNEQIRTMGARPVTTTTAAEGLPRWRWTTADLIRLTDLGIFTAEDRIELIGGEIVPMASIGRRHELVADELHQTWAARYDAGFRVTTERQLNLGEDTYTKPDLWVWPSAIKAYDVRGDTILLIVEVSDSSLKFDRGRKADLYASFGVREYWQIDAWSLETRVHREPGSAGYGAVTPIAAIERLVPHLVPHLSVRLADLDLGHD